MRSKRLLFILLLIGLLAAPACSKPTATVQPAGQATPTPAEPPPTNAPSGQRISAKEAVALAFASLPDDWKATARLAFVGRYSRLCATACSPLVVEDDPGIGADGRQAHWIVIFAKDESAAPANVYYVENGQVRLVKSDVAIIRPGELFALEGWVDSTAIQFRTSQPVGLDLRAGAFFADVDAELGAYALLWLAETSFGRFDIYDATTGTYIKSR